MNTRLIHYLKANAISHYLIFFNVGSLIGVFIIQPVNDMEFLPGHPF